MTTPLRPLQDIHGICCQVETHISNMPALTRGEVLNYLDWSYKLTAIVSAKQREIQASLLDSKEQSTDRRAALFDGTSTLSQWKWNETFNQDESYRIFTQEVEQLKAALQTLDNLRWELKNVSDQLAILVQIQ